VLLLDTHVWVWTVEGDRKRIGPRSRRLVERAQVQDVVHISPATLFEIVALHTVGRLRLARPVERWIEELLDQPGIRLAEFSAAVAIDAGEIPRGALADPLDRLLVAAARQLGAIFVTADRSILDYAARTRAVRTQDATK
jgi:PIN domain nuclease of toxin-antitoxin system